jgi:hypothetical protein
MSSVVLLAEHNRPSPLRRLMNTLALPLLLVGAGSAIVVSGAVLGQDYLPMGMGFRPGEMDFVGSFALWDGKRYEGIAKKGYSYNPDAMSPVQFFPAYPLAGRFIAAVTGWRVDFSLLLNSYLFLIAAGVATSLYVNCRTVEPAAAVVPQDPDLMTRAAALYPADRDAHQRGDAASFVLLALAFFPTTFYFRMAYTESFFLFEVILTLYGIKRRWPCWVLAPIIGLATATRATGVALIVPFVWYLWHHSPTWRGFLLRSVILVPTACWGLTAYVSFQYLAFGDGLAFVRTNKYWDERPPIPLAEKLWLELTLEPIFCEYDPSCKCHQRHSGRDPSPLFSMYYANPLYFLFFAGLVAFGAIKGWLTPEEVLTGAALLLLSYFSKGYDACMCSQARYASTVFPAYLVMGRLLQRLPVQIVAMIVAICALFLGIYSALFVRWYFVY